MSSVNNNNNNGSLGLLKRPPKLNIPIYDRCVPDQSICMCYQCVYNRKNIKKLKCDSCGIEGYDVYKYNSVYNKNGSNLCDLCAENECCEGCGWESYGSLCEYCKSDFMY